MCGEILCTATHSSLSVVAPHSSLSGSEYIQVNDKTIRDDILRAPIGVSAAFALDAIDDSGNKITTTAFTRGYPHSDDVLGENNVDDLVVQLDSPVTGVKPQSTVSSPDLKVVMNEIKATRLSNEADVEKNPPSNNRERESAGVPTRTDASLQSIVNKALTPETMVAKEVSKVTFYTRSNADNNVAGVKSSNNERTTRVKLPTGVATRDNCDETQRTSIVRAISKVMDNAIIFSFGVGVGIVSFITRQKIRVVASSSTVSTSFLVPTENDEGDTEISKPTYGRKSTGMTSYLDGLSSSPLEFIDLDR